MIDLDQLKIDMQDISAGAAAQREAYDARLRLPFEAAGANYEKIWSQCYDAAHAAGSEAHASWERVRTEQVMMMLGFLLQIGSKLTAKDITAANINVVAHCER